MSPVVERLLVLARHLDHLRELRPRITALRSLDEDLSLQNDVLRSLQVICQTVIDIASELSTRRKLRFEDYTQAVRNLAAFPEFSSSTVQGLEKLPAFRNALVHEYLALEFPKVIEALNQLEPVEEFLETVRRIEAAS
jgi:uncharacterized protein YutE (UPF0331/DUF86 family)